jgi:aminoglycoside 2''-phosphotransferase
MDATALTQDERAAAADRIAAFLRALHDLEPNPEVGSLLPHDDERIVAKQWFARAEREIAPKLRPLEARALRKQFEMHLSAPENYSFRPVVIHADFSRDHILMEDNSVVAVIDFGDANWGDPDYDFVYLFRDCGEAFVKEVARRYRHPNVEQLRMKFKYFDLVDQVDTILNGVGHALEGQEHSAWRRLKQLLRTS